MATHPAFPRVRLFGSVDMDDKHPKGVSVQQHVKRGPVHLVSFNDVQGQSKKTGTRSPTTRVVEAGISATEGLETKPEVLPRRRPEFVKNKEKINSTIPRKRPYEADKEELLVKRRCDTDKERRQQIRDRDVRRLPGTGQCLGEHHGDIDRVDYVKSLTDGALASVLCEVASRSGFQSFEKDWKQALLTAISMIFGGDDETKANVKNNQYADMFAPKFNVLYSHYIHGMRGLCMDMMKKIFDEEQLQKKVQEEDTMTTA